MALIALPCTKNARRIFAIVSTTSIPTSAPTNHGSQCGPLYSGVPIGCRSPRKGGPFCMPIHRRAEKMLFLIGIGAIDFPNIFEQTANPKFERVVVENRTSDAAHYRRTATQCGGF